MMDETDTTKSAALAQNSTFAVADSHGSPLALPVNLIKLEQPWLWLLQGWQDIERAPLISLGFGTIIACVSAGIFYSLWQTELLAYAAPLAAGFMFLAPALGVAFYDISRRLELGLPVTFWGVALGWRRYPGQIFTMGLVMMLFHLAWERLALLLYAVFFGTQSVSWDGFIRTIFFSVDGLPFLVTGTLLGSLLASTAFSVSIVAFPMLLDRDCGSARAIATSIRASLVNWRILVGWAALITLFTVAGIATGCVGLIITLPLIGHASWHAYRDLVPPT